LEISLELVRQNELREGTVYLQVTRGTAPRDFAFPAEPDPTVFSFCSKVAVVNHEKLSSGIGVLTVPDERWARRNIKSISMLPQVLAKQKARIAGQFEAWLVEEGHITEGSSSSAFIVKKGTLYTHPLTNRILAGTVRKALIELCRQDLKLDVCETPFTPIEAKEADEAFLTSASTFLLPVVEIDGTQIGNGRPGEISIFLRKAYLEAACRT
jgi:D-alanine transaminase